jgi:transposase
MKEYRDIHRPLAAEAFAAKNGDIPAATNEFLKRCQNMGLKAPRDAAGFVELWGQRWDKERSIEGHASNSGRKRKLSQDDAQLVVGSLRQGRPDEEGGPYGSIKECQQECAEVGQLLQKRNVSLSTVYRAVHRECPDMQYKELKVKPKFTAQQLDSRYSTAAANLEVITDNFKVAERVIWIDAKTMPMLVNSKKGWFIPSEKDTFASTLPLALKNPKQRKYYIAVNYRLGALLLVFCTGTTGMPADRDPDMVYLVS